MQLIGCRNNEILNRIPATISFVLRITLDLVLQLDIHSKILS